VLRSKERAFGADYDHIGSDLDACSSPADGADRRWRVGALYPLARGCRAPRRITAALPRPIFFFANLGGGAAAAGVVGDGATGPTATTA